MGEKIKVLVLYGGCSGEHEISLRSAASVIAHLAQTHYQIIPIGMDKHGQFFLNSLEDLLQYTDTLPVSTAASQLLPSLFSSGKLAIAAAVVFPVVHGPLYEDGCLQGLLKLANIAFVGSDVLSCAIAMDKDMSRRIVCANTQIHCAAYRTLSIHTTAAERQQFCRAVVSALGWPLFVKPCSLGSSVGIHKVTQLNDLYSAIDDAFLFDEWILIEQALIGREIELAVLENIQDNTAPRVSVPGEIRVHHTDGFYSYTAKYIDSDSTELIIPAQLSADLIHKLQAYSAIIFQTLKCRGLARVDFFVDDQQDKIYFNEINLLPGFTSISMYPRLWQASGLNYTTLLTELIQLALQHKVCRDTLITDYQLVSAIHC